LIEQLGIDVPQFVGLASPLSATLVVFWLVFRGTLVVRIQHDTIVRILEAQRDDAIGERDAWKLNSERKAETIQILTKTNNELMETAKFADHVMTAIQEKAGG